MNIERVVGLVFSIGILLVLLFVVLTPQIDYQQEFKVSNPITNDISLEKENIESRPLWKPMHLQPIFKNHLNFSNGISEKLFNTGLCLPSGSNLTDQDFGRIFEVLSRILKK